MAYKNHTLKVAIKPSGQWSIFPVGVEQGFRIYGRFPQ
jgi:hypothetical protein